MTIYCKTRMKTKPKKCNLCRFCEREYMPKSNSYVYKCIPLGYIKINPKSKIPKDCPLIELSPNKPNLIKYNELNIAMEAIDEIRPIAPDFPVNMSNKPIIPVGDAREEK